jgi:ribosomal protein S18 acetylase RimI-like enzyme
MNYYNIEYKYKTATDKILLNFYKAHSGNFIPPLDSVVNIEEYIAKLFEYSITIEAWVGEQLIALVAVYCNNYETREAYISSVIVSKDYQKYGIASNLLLSTMEYVKKRKFQSLALEVNKKNYPAYQLYLKLGFFELKEKENTILMKKIIF